MVTLNLSQEQAEVLVEILSRVGGSPKYSARCIAEEVKNLLSDQGIQSTFETEEEYPMVGVITCLDQP